MNIILFILLIASIIGIVFLISRLTTSEARAGKFIAETNSLKEVIAWETKIATQERVRLENETRTLRANNSDLTLRLNSLETFYKNQLESWKIQEERRIRDDAVSRSRQVQKGFAAEAFAPFDLEYDRRDYRYLGDPLDFVIFSGSSAIKDGARTDISEVIFLDIKTGESSLNTTQRRIRDAVNSGKVRFATYNTDTKTLKWWNNAHSSQ